MHMNYIQKISANLKSILNTDDTTITNPLCLFTHCINDDINLVTALMNCAKPWTGLPSMSCP